MKNLLILLSSIFVTTAVAQKLPDLQVKEIKVPTTIKIDGDDKDWGSEYGAFNKKLDVYYTLSNDSKNLYLVMKSRSDGKDINKIITAGFALTINTKNEKKVEDGFSVSYPIQSTNAIRSAATQVRTIVVSGSPTSSGSFRVEGMDSILNASRNKQLEAAKEIKVKGFSAIQDSVISVYNEHNILVGAKINAANEYVYELAIPLNLLGLNAAQSKEIAYQLRTNPIVRINPEAINNATVTINGVTTKVGDLISALPAGGMGGFNDSLIPNEVWGKYKIIQH